MIENELIKDKFSSKSNLETMYFTTFDIDIRTQA